MMVRIPIAPSSNRDMGNGPETRPGIEPPKGDVASNFPAPPGTLALQGGEEVSIFGIVAY